MVEINQNNDKKKAIKTIALEEKYYYALTSKAALNRKTIRKYLEDLAQEWLDKSNENLVKEEENKDKYL